MVIQSFFKSDFGFRPVKVEVVLLPGVSQIQILGLPDQVIKESCKRIIAALRHQGFRIPPGKQVLVNLHPSNLKKTSQGIDLAIAMGILLESKQLEPTVFDHKTDYCYGSLSLKGEIQAPEDLKLLNFEKFSKKVLTGPSQEHWRFDTLQVDTLSDFAGLKYQMGEEQFFQCEDHPVADGLLFDSNLAKLMTIAGVGEHPLLIAGYSGCGKTTLVENLATILASPSDETFLESKKYWMLSGRNLTSRPIVQPHHSTTPVAMIGGGASLKFGEISLAHGGALILDELLEFHPSVQSALREPMEKGKIYLSRAGGRRILPADSLILGTTNLCPCGNFQPGATYKCRCSSQKLRSYIERLTGPFLDRFTLFHIYQKPKLDDQSSLTQIQEEICKAQEFKNKQRGQSVMNQKLSLQSLEEQLDPSIDSPMIPHTRSHRRKLSLLRVARTLADMDGDEKIKQLHLEEAKLWTVNDIYRLEQFRMEDFATR